MRLIAPAMANKKKTVNKSAWVRSQPLSLSAKEVLDKAKKEGIQMTVAQVYTARSTGKKHALGASGSDSSGKLPATHASSDEAAFRRLVLNVGLVKAKEMLDAMKRDVGL